MKKDKKKQAKIDLVIQDVQDVINEGKESGTIDVGKLSDGYHSFDDLYRHRHALFIALCKQIEYDFTQPSHNHVWRSKKHSDGGSLDGFFIMGIGDTPKKMVTYHIPVEYWKETEFANTLEAAPAWDGHTPEDVLKRLTAL